MRWARVRLSIFRCFFFRIRFRRFLMSDPMAERPYRASSRLRETGAGRVPLRWSMPWPVVQLAEHLTLDQGVAGSSPARPAKPLAMGSSAHLLGRGMRRYRRRAGSRTPPSAAGGRRRPADVCVARPVAFGPGGLARRVHPARRVHRPGLLHRVGLPGRSDGPAAEQRPVRPAVAGSSPAAPRQATNRVATTPTEFTTAWATIDGPSRSVRTTSAVSTAV